MKPQPGLPLALAVLFAGLLIGGCAGHPARAVNELQEAIFNAPETALMVVIDDPRSERQRRGIRSPGYSTSLAYENDPALARAASKLATDHGLNLIGQWPLRNLAVHCLVVAEPSSSVLAALKADPRVRWVQPFNRFATQGQTEGPQATSGPTPGIQELFASLSEQGEGVRIAVIDTAIDQTHPDLLGSSVRQRNFAGQRGRPAEEEHGTAVVGLIAATPGGPDGVTGFARKADVRLLRACWQLAGALVGKCNTLTLARALDAAIDLRPQVLNLSLTGRYDRVLQELLEVLLDSGTIVIAAYDEQRDSADRFPSAQAGVVYAYGAAVAGSQPARRVQEDGLVLHAPRHALSLAPMAGYDLVSGHSIAAPHVSALAARLIEGQPLASRAQILSQLALWLGQN